MAAIFRLFRKGGAPEPGVLLTRYLMKTYPDEIEQILAAVMYEGHENGVYRYRNRLTRRCITLDSRGRLVSMEPFALDYYY
ncbi:hypothetical protein ASL14_26385 (plasmid) [Paenibacillus sp. IHB B 3084]|uniref:hypothetical protein n=1 Tax=Paenibacillus sp. IHB B 3084 TaxID=867076 RepID=UPI0007207F11|nr:hypothetical protein [Paenibacillus sp. IHB B 3084]ALP39405.1 hypothetical protein ASL14_26385 [Paenibacillus sp. IHB B 3084]